MPQLKSRQRRARRTRKTKKEKNPNRWGSRDKDQTTPHHQPLLSSLVVRPPVSDGAGDGVRGGGGSDYETGEVRRYRSHAGSASPVRRRDADHRHGSSFDQSGGTSRSREFGSRRDTGRYRDPSPPPHARGRGGSPPPHARGRGGGRPPGRAFDGPAFGPGPFRGDGVGRNNPNVRPREGDWICPDPLCTNLNFARRECCNNCKRFRNAPGGSPRRGHPGPLPLPLPLPPPDRRIPGPPIDISPGRTTNGYRSPLRGWARDGPRDFGPGGLPPRHDGRFSEHMRSNRLEYPEDDYRGKNKPMPPMNWGHRDHWRDNFYHDRKVYGRRPPSPPVLPLPTHGGRWLHDRHERSRSPDRGARGAPPPKDYHLEMYGNRGRGDRRGMRNRIGGAY